jgi:hypothetical protein
LFRGLADESGRSQIKAIDEGVDETNRVVGADVVIEGFGEKQRLVAAMAGDMRRARILSAPSPRRNPRSTGFHTVCWVFAGPNGAGKSTLAAQRVRGRLPVANPDEIAQAFPLRGGQLDVLAAGRCPDAARGPSGGGPLLRDRME